MAFTTSQGAAQKSPSVASSAGWRGLSQTVRWFLLGLAALILVGSFWISLRRPLWPAIDTGPRFPTPAWWDTPLEVNRAGRFPTISGTLISLSATEDRAFLFLAGADGMILRYEVATDTWERLPPISIAKTVSLNSASAVAQQQPQQQQQQQKRAKSPYLNAANTPAHALPKTMMTPNAPAEVTEPDSSGGSIVLKQIAFRSREQGAAVSQDGRLLWTLDGGRTWTEGDFAHQVRVGNAGWRSDGTLVVTDADFERDGGIELFSLHPGSSNVFDLAQVNRGIGEPSSTNLAHAWFGGVLEDRLIFWSLNQMGGASRHFTGLAGLAGHPVDPLVAPEFSLPTSYDLGGQRNRPLFLFSGLETQTSLIATAKAPVAGPDNSTVAALVPVGWVRGRSFRDILVRDENDVWLCGADGQLLRSRDGGVAWGRASRIATDPEPGSEWRLPTPWFFLTLFPVGFLLLLAWRPLQLPPRRGIADRLASDKPLEAGERDHLGFNETALGLSAYLRNEATTGPLTIAINGPWGSGKSSLMNLLRADLERWSFKTVYFNAWHHETEEHLLAALLEAIRGQAIPGWFDRGGLRYRARLVWRRSRGHVFILGLLALALATCLGYFAADGSRADHIRNAIEARLDKAKALKALFVDEPTAAPARQADGDVAEPSSAAPAPAPLAPTEPAKIKLTFFGAVLSFVTLLAALYRGLRSFGLEPSKLLASKTRRPSTGDLTNQTSFRYRFMPEFRDVTAALQPLTMTIFVDDLDRCQPEHAYRVLEAVNFLMTSGECFVVLGLERERIERGIGLAFERLAALEPAAPGDAGKIPAQVRFARRYLEKLINVQVEVPKPTTRQLTNLLRDRLDGAGDGKDAPQIRRFASVDPVAACMLLTPLAAVVLFFGAAALFPPKMTQPKLVQAAAAVRPASIASAGEADRGEPSAVSDQALQASTPIEPGAFEPPVPGTYGYWLVAALGFAVVGIGLWRLSIPPGAALGDLPEFEEALECVAPVLAATPGATPRRLKRFVNSVRYLAMMQGRYTRAPVGWEALRRRIVEWIFRHSTPARSAPTIPSRTLSEEELVILACVHEVTPEVFDHEGQIAVGTVDALVHGSERAADFKRMWSAVSPEDVLLFRELAQGFRVAAPEEEPHVSARPGAAQSFA